MIFKKYIRLLFLIIMTSTYIFHVKKKGTGKLTALKQQGDFSTSTSLYQNSRL